MTTRVGVVGWPVAHSRSPVIFGHWFARYGLDARYERIAVPPEEAAAFFAAIPDDIAGLNVTIPHKETAARAVTLEGAGARLGVVNTLWREDGAVKGTSSDGSGFLASLEAAAPGWSVRREAVVLGAGGAAVAVADALASRGLSLTIANRTPGKAEALAARVGGRAVPWERLPDTLARTGLLVNATSLGMAGGPPLTLDCALLPDGAIVADIVYTPLETALLAAARARGLVAVDGLGMLLHQATVGFQRWFGIVPEVDDALREAALETL